MLFPMFASSRRRIVVLCFEDKEFQGSKCCRVVRVAFHWRKASVPYHLLPMLYLQEYFCINWKMERPPRKTVLPQDICLYLGQLIRKPGVRYALPDRGWGLPVVGV
jgi:hypothetical protein